MNLRITILLIMILTLTFAISCGGDDEKKQLVEEPKVIGTFPIDSIEDFTPGEYSSLDTAVSFDGNGSMKIVVPESTTVQIMTLGPQDYDGIQMIYKAKVKTEDVIGQVFLEMLCEFEDKGEFFSRGQDHILTSTTDWTEVETPFFLKTGDKPSGVKFNIVVNGSGTVWVDDIKLLTKPFKY